jgi:L-aspartate oxidase
MLRSRITCDVLIMGGGAAGITAALAAADSGARVVLIDAGTIGRSGSTFYPKSPTRGIQAGYDDASTSRHRDETIITAQGEINPGIAEILAAEAPRRVEHLCELGLPFRRDRGGSLIRETGCFSTDPRAVILDDLKGAGDTWRDALTDAGVTLLDHHFALRVVHREGTIEGAIVRNEETLLYIMSPAVVLATGGGAGAWRRSMAPDRQVASALGLTHGLALPLRNLHYVQFMLGTTADGPHPFLPIPHLAKGASLRNGNAALLDGWIPEQRHDDATTMRAAHFPFSMSDDGCWIDIAVADAEQPTWTSNTGPILHRETDTVDLASYAHAFNGGIAVDENGATEVPGLWAAGEAAGGHHGADRLGGNMMTACLVFGHRAGINAAAWASEHPLIDAPEPVISSDALDPQTCRMWTDRIRSLLDQHASVIRNADGLQRGLAELRECTGLLEDMRNSVDPTTVRLIHLHDTAAAVLEACLAHPESKGAHYRSDDPLAQPPGASAGFAV